jgi:hypothetical protein
MYQNVARRTFSPISDAQTAENMEEFAREVLGAMSSNEHFWRSPDDRIMRLTQRDNAGFCAVDVATAWNQDGPAAPEYFAGPGPQTMPDWHPVRAATALALFLGQNDTDLAP